MLPDAMEQAPKIEDGGGNAKGQLSRRWWHREADPVARITGWLALWTGMLFLATIALVVVATLQWQELRDTDHHIAQQLDIMRAGQRAWVSVGQIELDGPLILLDGKAQVSIKVPLKNTGNLPALKVISVIHLYPNRLTEFPPDCNKTAHEGGFGYTLFPGEASPHGFSWSATTEAGGRTTPLPESGRFSVGIVGCVLYVSAGDATVHATGFSGVILRKGANLEDSFFDTEKKQYEPNELSLISTLPIPGRDAK